MLRKLFVLVAAVTLLIVGSAWTQAAGNTITDIAAGDSRFTTLVTALKATGLDTVLAGTGPFTVFAPTNDAFAKLPAGTVPALLQKPTALASILTYHVVSGAVPASTVVTLSSATTVNGAPVLINVVNGGVVLNGSVHVIITDIKASNGIIHVIDSVLLPPTTISNQLYLITATQNVLPLPGGQPLSGTVNACQTFFVNQIWQNFGQVQTVGGYIDLRGAVPVAANYGQNGAGVPSNCVGK